MTLIGTAFAQTAIAPLTLDLIVSEPEVCLGTQKLGMKVVFSNNGDSPISIYKSSIYNFSFTKTTINRRTSKVETQGRRKDLGTGDPARHELPIVLQPRASIVLPIQYDLSDPFFRDSGTYSIRVRYAKLATTATPKEAIVGDTASNESLFQISPCEQ